ncbi:MAG: phospho-N-acetylmuramoyl-pentapeptide-transferase [Planctomycetota bacterium]|jgi:phospho-N-acetylmuramoyl-pentapeptide-transferase
MFPGLLADEFGLQLFGYISFRTAMASLTAFAIALIAGGPTIRWLRAHRVREDVHKTASIDLAELNKRTGKKDTTTMGGSFLVGALLISVLLWGRLDNVHVVLAVVLTFGLAAVGFVDDFLKLTVKNSRGLNEVSKLVGQTVVCALVLLSLAWYAKTSDRWALLTVYPPFFKDASFSFGEYGAIGIGLFVVFGWFVIVGTSNAANITDGLDGLAAGCMLISGLALSIFCYVTGRPDWTEYLQLPHIPAASEMAVVGGALCGACMGFLWFNANPAEVFMGDSGSLPLGGLLAWMALIAKQELVLPLLGFVFFVEMGSSALQRIYYKRTGERIFTMAPIHHGLQVYGGIFKKGPTKWPESRIVIRGWIIAAVCAMASLSLLKVR